MELREEWQYDGDKLGYLAVPTARLLDCLGAAGLHCAMLDHPKALHKSTWGVKRKKKPKKNDSAAIFAAIASGVGGEKKNSDDESSSEEDEEEEEDDEGEDRDLCAWWQNHAYSQLSG